ncbi:hypothetical protein GCM10009861_21640 [Neomicrococcus aestuarii]
MSCHVYNARELANAWAGSVGTPFTTVSFTTPTDASCVVVIKSRTQKGVQAVPASPAEKDVA